MSVDALTAVQTCPCWGGGNGMGSGMWGSGFLWPLLALLVVAAIAVGAAYLFASRSTGNDADRATELLREQYARGEISDEEFEERASKLASGRPR